MFVPQGGVLLVGAEALTAMLLVAAAFAHVGPNTFEITHRWRPAAAVGMATLLVLALVRMYGADTSPFLYFQF
jgi:hypothetical protein